MVARSDSIEAASETSRQKSQQYQNDKEGGHRVPRMVIIPKPNGRWCCTNILCEECSETTTADKNEESTARMFLGIG